MSITEATTRPSLKQLALGDINHELSTTRKLLERVPEAHLDWKPHEKSMTLGGLALHVATIPFWLTRVLGADFFDLATATRNPPPTSVQEILDAFEDRVSAMRQALDAAAQRLALQQGRGAGALRPAWPPACTRCACRPQRRPAPSAW